MITKNGRAVKGDSVLEAIAWQGSLTPDQLADQLNAEIAPIRRRLRQWEARKLIRWDRKTQVCSLNPDFGRLIGVDLGASHLHFALTDFSGQTISETNRKIRPEAGPQRLIAQIKREIAQLTARKGKHRLRGLAIGVPSPVDPISHRVSFANNLPGWINVNLKEELERAFGVPVALENDANMAAIGEQWRGVARGVQHFVFIALGTGVGAGVFINGELYRGRTGAAGELYRLHLEWPNWSEDFGDKGFFETYASGQGIAALGRKLMGCATDSKDLAQRRDAFFVFDAFRRGDPQARQTLETIFTILAIGIANVVAVLDPELIVLGGGIARGAPEFMLSTIDKVAKHIQPNLPPVRLSTLEDKAQTCGAVFSAMRIACDRALGHQPH